MRLSPPNRSSADDSHSNLERSRDQLLQIEKLASVGKLAAGMAHEILNPLTAIKMWLFSIRNAVGLDEELDRKFAIVSEEMGRLEALVRNFLEFCRPPSPTIRPQRAFAVMEKTGELVRHPIRNKRIRFQCEEPPAMPPVLCDPQQLEQVLLNLLVNAVEATPEGGVIRLWSALERGMGDCPSVVIRVEDTGPGIAELAQARIFEPFYTTKENGTGLGLYIAAQIMAQLGGGLALERSGPGGSCFAVWAPAAVEEGDEQNPGRG